MKPHRIDRRRLLQTVVLVIGLMGMAVVVDRTIEDAREQVMPHPAAIAVAVVFILAAVVAVGRAWAALFREELESRAERHRMAGTYYTSQLTKYLPAGGAVHAVTQVSLARATGMPLGQVALAFPVFAAALVIAGTTLGAGLAFASDLPGWARVVALLGLVSPVALHHRLLVGLLKTARRVVSRIPSPDRLPTQRSIMASYAWSLVFLAAYAAGYTVLLGSLTGDVSLTTVFFAYAVSWVAGFLAVPIPAGVGVREAVLVAIVPGIGAGPLVAASLAHRLVAIAAELTVAGASSRISRHSLQRGLMTPVDPRGRQARSSPALANGPRAAQRTGKTSGAQQFADDLTRRGSE